MSNEMIAMAEAIQTLTSASALLLEKLRGMESAAGQQPATPGEERREWMDVDQAAEYLNTTKHGIYKLTSAKALPSYKPGGCRLSFRRADLDAYMEKARRRTDDELNAEASRIAYRVQRRGR